MSPHKNVENNAGDLAPAHLVKLYNSGVNISQYLRSRHGVERNSSEIIELAYELQAGSYVQRLEDPAVYEFQQGYTDRIAREIAAHARARGVDAADFALAWVLNNRLVTSAIAGPRTDEQWEAYQHALEFAFSAEDEAFVNGLVAAGHASTPGFNDPSHPVEGRVSIVAPAPVAAPAQARQVA